MITKEDFKYKLRKINSDYHDESVDLLYELYLKIPTGAINAKKYYGEDYSIANEIFNCYLCCKIIEPIWVNGSFRGQHIYFFKEIIEKKSTPQEINFDDPEEILT